MAKKGFVAEFKEFISRGNVMDLAVGVIIGGAFQSIVKSLVEDIVMPVISLVTGGVNFSQWKIIIGPERTIPLIMETLSLQLSIFF